MSDTIIIGQQDGNPVHFALKRANRHGFITGATGTGKTVTLQTLAQQFAIAGIPVFAVDIKGDLSGIAIPKDPATILPPVTFWDIFGNSGIPIRTTVTEFGPLLMARLMELSDAQSGVLEIGFKLADDQGLALIDLKDIQALLNHMGENAKTISREYGLVAPQSIAAIQRALLRLNTQGCADFFGEPAMTITDFMRTDRNGMGMINILAADKLFHSTKLYATFLLWLLSELYEELPEAGDLDQPKFCVFFDEAHLMFEDIPDVLMDKINQVIRLIRSKAVGVYFCTQNPLDLPETVLAQLGNRIQHALRAYTPKETKAIRVLAETFRANPGFDTESIIPTLGIGEALVSTLDEKGVPGIVEKVKIDLPPSSLGAITPAQRAAIIADSPLVHKYTTTIDRESAYERLEQKTREATPEVTQKAEPKPRASNRQTVPEALMKSVVRAAGSSLGRQIGNQILRGILGSLTRK